MSLDLALSLIGILYGIVLILAMFVKNSRITDAMRVDKLIFPASASESTRPLNLVFGIIVLGYYTYMLLRDFFGITF
ncbi:hypothetical protein EPN18_06565 [bacterium]|nr:MAG: hypothetical protein EPN18_06565 [bacterium]